MTTLADRAERIPIQATLGKAKHDPRTPEQFLADLEAETTASLAKDPTRWPWVRSGTTSRPRPSTLPSSRRRR